MKRQPPLLAPSVRNGNLAGVHSQTMGTTFHLLFTSSTLVALNASSLCQHYLDSSPPAFRHRPRHKIAGMLTAALRAPLRRGAASLQHVPQACLSGMPAAHQGYVLDASGFAHGGVGAPRYATTILSVRKGGKLAVVGDGQMTAGNMVVKPNATKVRRIGDGKVIVGFAGATADAMALLERLESKLEQYSHQLARACVELAKDWRTERYMRRLEAALIVANEEVTLEVTGNGDVLEPVDGVMAIGSGSPFATAAARALLDSDHSAMEIAERAMTIAGDMCVYTNHCFVKDEMDIITHASAEKSE